jgi:accessory gene regulator protein AgrB
MDCVLYFSIIAFILKTYHDFEIDSSFYPDVLLFISNSLFLFEFVIGSIAKGMWMNKGCFITYTW